MRFWLIVIILYFFGSNVVLAQDDILNGLVEIENNYTTKEDILNDISKKTGLTFSFSQDLPVFDTIHIPINNTQTVKEFLIELFGEKIQWKLIDKKVVLKISNIDSDDENVIQGTVIDALTGRPLSGASILLKNSKPIVGTTADLGGKFILNIDGIQFSDSIVISYVGYQTYAIDVFANNHDEVYRLISKSIDLKEVFVVWKNPIELLTKALKAVRNNYPDKPSQLRAFYRESLKRNNKYMTYIEGLLDIYKCAYRPTLLSDQARLLRLRKFSNIESNDSVYFKLRGGINATLELDLLRNPFSFVSINELDNYKYSYAGVESIANIATYKIRFEPSIINPEMDYMGAIYIDIQTMAIVNVEFQLTDEALKKPEYNVVLSSSPKVKVKPKSIVYNINYKNTDGKYHINHVSGNITLGVRHKRKFLGSRYKVHFEMITTDVTNKVACRFKNNEKVRSRQILADVEDFSLYNLNQDWDIDMLITPENDLIKALGKFKVEELTFSN